MLNVLPLSDALAKLVEAVGHDGSNADNVPYRSVAAGGQVSLQCLVSAIALAFFQLLRSGRGMSHLVLHWVVAAGRGHVLPEAEGACRTHAEEAGGAHCGM